MKIFSAWGFILFVITITCFGYSSRPPTRTGAPSIPDNGQTCISCHGSSSSGSLVISNLPNQYESGQKYIITIKLSQSGQRRWGFILTALDKNGKQAGNFANINAKTQIFSSKGRQYIGHTSIGTAAGKENSNTWLLNWTAPRLEVGSISFYASGNAANNNFGISGDNGYKTQVTIEPKLGINTPPVAFTQSVNTTEDTVIAIKLVGADAENDKLTYTVVDQPSKGALSGIIPDLTYKPYSKYNGSDSFTFKVNDGIIDSTKVRIFIFVRSVVNIPNTNLRIKLEMFLGKNKGETITNIELAKLKGKLDVSSANIKNLKGLEYCSNLTQLDLSNNLISDISPLSNLSNLNRLRLEGNPLTTSANPIIQKLKAGGTHVFHDPLTTSGKLTGDVNADNTVNIFDLVIVASQFGQVEDDLKGDLNDDGQVNIFDLVLVAANFGKLLAATPSVMSKIALTADQKHHINSAIEQLKSNTNLSKTEKIVLDILKLIQRETLPIQNQLLPNYPNPFNPETWIPFRLAYDSIVVAKIYDTIGRNIRVINLGYILAGNYIKKNKAIYWDGKTNHGEYASSGTYFYQIEVNGYTETKKMVILK